MVDTEAVIAGLEATKRALLEDGWCQNNFHQIAFEDDGVAVQQHCLLGAMHVATGIWLNQRGGRVTRENEDLLSEVRMAVVRALGGDSVYSVDVGYWNDNPTRTLTEVVDTLDRAIIGVKERASGV